MMKWRLIYVNTCLQKLKSFFAFYTAVDQSPNQEFQPKSLLVWEALCLATQHILVLMRVHPGPLQRKLRVTEVSTPVEAAHKMVANTTQQIMPRAVQLGTSQLPSLRFSVIFLPVVRQIPGHNAKMGHRLQSPTLPKARWPHQSVCPLSYVISRLGNSVFRTDSQPAKVLSPLPKNSKYNLSAS